MRELSPLIRVAIHKFADTEEEREDLLQDCWVRIIERLDRYEPRGSFSAWAVKVSENICRRKRRDAKRAGVVEVELPANLPEQPETEEESRGDGESEKGYWGRVVHEALARLSDNERNVLVLQLLEGKTTAEAAGILGVSEDAVESIQRRGMTRLRRMEDLRELMPAWKGWE